MYLVRGRHLLTMIPTHGTVSWYFFCERMSFCEGLGSETGWLWYHPTNWKSLAAIDFWICCQRRGQMHNDNSHIHWWEIIDLLLPTFLSAAEHCSGSVSSHRQGKAWHTSRPAHDKIHSFVMSYAWEITTAIYNDRMFKRYKTYFCRQGHISLQGNQTLPQWIGGSENPNRIICT